MNPRKLMTITKVASSAQITGQSCSPYSHAKTAGDVSTATKVAARVSRRHSVCSAICSAARCGPRSVLSRSAIGPLPEYCGQGLFTDQDVQINLDLLPGSPGLPVGAATAGRCGVYRARSLRSSLAAALVVATMCAVPASAAAAPELTPCRGRSEEHTSE